MTREECIALLDRYANYNGMGIPNLTGCKEAMKKAVELLSAKPDKSLEEAAEEYATEWHENPDGSAWKPYFEVSAIKVFKAGAEWQKKQMMKKAVEGEVIKTDKHTSVRYKAFYGTDRYFYGIADKQFKPGDKVRIIIVKEEKK